MNDTIRTPFTEMVDDFPIETHFEMLLLFAAWNRALHAAMKRVGNHTNEAKLIQELLEDPPNDH